MDRAVGLGRFGPPASRRTRKLQLALIATLLLAGPAAAADSGAAARAVDPGFTLADWPTLARNGQRQGSVPFELPLASGRLNLRWKRFFGERIEVEMEPVVVGGRVYVGVMNGKLYALDRETGAVLWVFQAGGGVTNTPTATFSEGQLRLVFGALDGVVTCLDGATGTERWRFLTDGPVMMTPAVHEGTVLVGTTAGTFYGLDLADAPGGARLRWSLSAGSPLTNTPAVGPVGGGTTAVFFTTGANGAYALNAATGSVLWQRQLQGIFTKRTTAVYGQGSGGRRVLMLVTRKAGAEYSEPRENLPLVLQRDTPPIGPKEGPVVVDAWADFYNTYPRRRPLYFLDATNGNDLWDHAGNKALFTPLYIPYWGEYVPIVDDAGFAWLAASGSGGDHSLEHDERLWKVDLQTGALTHVAHAAAFKLRADEVGRATLVGTRYYQALSEDLGYYDTATGATNGTVFGNGFSNHRYPIEVQEYVESGGTITVFGGRHRHFGRFGSSGPGGFGGANDAISRLVAVQDGGRSFAFLIAWGHLYALTPEPVSNPQAFGLDVLDLTPGPPARGLTVAQARQELAQSVNAIVSAGHVSPTTRMWAMGPGLHPKPAVMWQSGETVRSLADALPYVTDSQLRSDLTSYLQTEIQQHLLVAGEYSGRACLDWDSGQLQTSCTSNGIFVDWQWGNPNLVAERLYALYRFALSTADTGAGWQLVGSNWTFIRNTMYSRFKTAGGGGWDPTARFFIWPKWISALGGGVANDNFIVHLQMAAVLAVREMANHVGDTATRDEAATYLTEMTQGRLAWGHHVRSLYDTGVLQPDDYPNWQDWGYEQANTPIPVEGVLNRSNDFRQPYGINADRSVDFVFTRQGTYPYYLPGFHPVLEDLVGPVRSDPELMDVLADNLAALEMLNPFWYLGELGHSVVLGRHEDDSFSSVAAADMFQAKAYIQRQPFESLRDHLPLPFEGYGRRDIHRLQNLVALLWAAEHNASDLIFRDGFQAATTPGSGAPVARDLPDREPHQPPVARASGTPAGGYAPLAVAFDGTRSFDPDGTITSFVWDFGDGATGSGATVSHAYSSPGSFEALLTVTDDQGATATTTITVGVCAPPANLLQNGDFEVFQNGQPVGWQGLGSSDVASSPVHSGAWAVAIHHTDFTGTGPTFEQGWIPVSPGATYSLTGWFRCDGWSGSDWGYVRFSVVEADWSERSYAPQELASFCGDGHWHRLGLTFAPAGNQIRVRFGINGPKRNAHLFFDDLRLFAKGQNQPPVGSPWAHPLDGQAPLGVAFHGNSDDCDGAVRHFVWDFGDGGSGRGEDAAHTYTARGTYLANLMLHDNDGATTSAAFTVTVTDPSAPDLVITTPTTAPTFVTAASSLAVGGTTAVAGPPLVSIVWDNADTGDVGSIPAGSSWASAPIPLKPGRNRILVTATDAASKVATDAIEVLRSVPGPQITGVQATGGPVARYAAWLATFQVATAAPNLFFSYDPAPPPGVEPGVGVTVEGVFVTPSGATLVQPAFHTTVVTVAGGRYAETTTRRWEVRFTPREVGTYQASLRATDATGTTVLPLAGFGVVSSGRHGFIRVSPDDARYFEHADRTLFFPVGRALGGDSAQNQGVLNLARPWLGGTGAYSTNWARWISSAEQHGNEGFMSRLTFGDRYPGSDLAYELLCTSTCGATDEDRDGWRLWQGWMIPETGPYLVSGRRYRVKLRLKTDGLTAINVGAPFGVVVKMHGWRGGSQTWRQYLDGLPPANTLLGPAHTGGGWHTVMATAVAPSTESYVSVYLHNVTSGRVYVDEISVREVDVSGNVIGGEQIRNPRADMHTYVDPRGAAVVDAQVAAGEAAGVAFKYVVQDKNDWIPNHLTWDGIFNATGDGYYQGVGTRVRWLQQQWWRYLQARWGYSASVHSWELNNEGSPDSQAHYQATQDFSSFLESTGAHPHLATTSFWCCWRPGFWGDSTHYPDVGYADLHEYTDNSGLGGQQGALEADFAGLHLFLVDKVKASPVGKPVVRAESGLAPGSPHYETLRTTPNPGVWFHNLLWVQLDSAGVFDFNYWWDEHFRQVDLFLYGEDRGGACRVDLARSFATFASGLDLNQGGYADLGAVVQNPELRVVGQKNAARRRAHLWIQNRRHTWKKVMDDPGSITPQSGTVRLAMGGVGQYAVEWWDTTSGGVVRSETLVSDGAGVVTLVVTNLTSDVAVRLGPALADLIFRDGFED